MMDLTLYRMVHDPLCTIGRIEDAEGQQVCFTLELPWKDNLPSVSCIPAGDYVCRRDMHGKTKPNPYQVWEVTGVPGRSEIHIHKGNRARDVLGCIIVGERLGMLGGERAVLDSAKAFAHLMRLTESHDSITLHIKDAE